MIKTIERLEANKTYRLTRAGIDLKCPGCDKWLAWPLQFQKHIHLEPTCDI